MVRLDSWFEDYIFGAGGASGKSCSSGAGGADGAGSEPVVVTFTGSGGKTSLIRHLACSFAQTAQRRILVTPSTKMLIPPAEEKFFDRYFNGLPKDSMPGITLAGNFNEKTGKLESLSLSALEGIISAYDLVLIEGDGSRELPLKGWEKYEPVVPSFTDITIGIIPVLPLGKPISEKIIHRLPQFCALTGAKPDEPISPAHLAAAISGSIGSRGAANSNTRSLFSSSQGKKLLFINQVEDTNTMKHCLEIINLLPKKFRQTLNKIIIGSVMQNTLNEIF